MHSITTRRTSHPVQLLCNDRNYMAPFPGSLKVMLTYRCTDTYMQTYIHADTLCMHMFGWVKLGGYRVHPQWIRFCYES